jgi:cyclic pyranopterin phosphate synthase
MVFVETSEMSSTLDLPVLSSRPSRLPLMQFSPSSPLADNYGRPVTYLRLAITDRCNLRCAYCMPERMTFLPQRELLTFDEMERLVSILAGLGIRKVRITGGEPFVRAGVMDFLWRLRDIHGVEEINITTNGVLTAPLIPELVRLGVGSLNLSADSFDRERFRLITRRDEFDAVERTFYAALEHGVNVKVNAVVMEGKNTDDIVPMAERTRHHAFEMRFIEEMPFNGGQTQAVSRLAWDYAKIVATLQSAYPTLQMLEGDVHSTSQHFTIEGHRGTVGVIAGFSRTFCGACNRLRITAKGMLKTCLYDAGVADLRALLRSGASDDELRSVIIHAVQHRFQDGFEAERDALQRAPTLDSMSVIGG